uniref:Uncharacterized protein n=1 Tax=Arundo donax TaxID=35708 RepID=A0A0A8Y9H0_ARUDO
MTQKACRQSASSFEVIFKWDVTYLSSQGDYDIPVVTCIISLAVKLCKLCYVSHMKMLASSNAV